MSAPVRTQLTRVIVVAFMILAVLLLPVRFNPLPPKQLSYHIEAGAVSRGMVTSQSRRGGKKSIPIRPHHLTFTSSNGPVELFVTRFEIGAGKGEDSIQKMMAATEEIPNGKIPDDLVAQARGTEGSILLHRWPYGHVYYMVYLRPEQTSDVTVTAHYAP